MDRHLIVERPDGSVAIAFNEDVPPPELPQEPSTRPGEIRITGTKFCEMGKVATSIFFYISLFIMTSFFRVIDIVNAIFMLTTLTVVVTGQSHATIQVVIHGIASSLIFLPLVVFHMWFVAAYQLGVVGLCMYLQLTFKYIYVQL
jgi:hypothetical protein